MAGKRTLDGIDLQNIVHLALERGIGIREGGKHPLMLEYSGMRPCPIATSTHAKRMVAPWIAQAIGRARREVYQALRQGYWN